MSRERNLKRLKASLRDTQEILADLVSGTGHDASKRLTKANKRLQGTYDRASAELNALMMDSTKDVRKQYASTRKDVEKQYASTRKDLNKQTAKAKDQLEHRFADTKAALRNVNLKTGLGAGALALAAKTGLAGKAAGAATFLAKTGLAAKAVELATKADVKTRTANLLERAAGGFVSARNRLNPDNQVVILSHKDRHNISKAGYFVRFSALAIIIISKRHKLMELGTQLYNKLKDSDGRSELTQDVKDQFDTLNRLIKAYSNGQYREFPYRSLVKIVAAVVYFVSVADLIPDFIPVLGLTDDLAILAWVFSSVKDDLQQFVDWEAAEEKRRSRLAGKSEDNKSEASQKSTSATGSIANVGNASVADRKASPNVSTSTGSETGSKATVTTATTGSSGSSTGSTGTSGAGSSSSGNADRSSGSGSGSGSGNSSNAGTSNRSGGSNTGNQGGSNSGNQGGSRQS